MPNSLGASIAGNRQVIKQGKTKVVASGTMKL